MFLGVVSVVWLLNLYNFMDGIDAIAATEVLFVNAMSSILPIQIGDMALALLSASLFTASAGFLSGIGLQRNYSWAMLEVILSFYLGCISIGFYAQWDFNCMDLVNSIRSVHWLILV